MGKRKAIMIGDVVGEPGIAALEAGLGALKAEYGADLVVVNGENAAGGFGLTKETLERILAAGADVVTSGNHVWEKRDLWPILDSEERLIRPANYPSGAAGRGSAILEKDGVLWCVANLQGREDMTPIDCPFQAMDALLKADHSPLPLILVDFHAESNQEKEALGLYADGRIAALAGTHTHVQTADDRLLPGGTAYITDLGMTGVRDSIIGMDGAICLERNKTQIPHRMECAVGPASIRGVCIEVDTETRLACGILRIDRAIP
jgi:metallophosphoesterase (TIGR00282 family)